MPSLDHQTSDHTGVAVAAPVEAVQCTGFAARIRSAELGCALGSLDRLR
jgi:hypothetical protein